MIPQDPVILLSCINTRLRDRYPNLDELCAALSVDKQESTAKPEGIDHRYDRRWNKFVWWGMDMIKVLFICHGNICRSPMAEFVMKDLVRAAGLADQFEIASAATSAEELGCSVYPPARRVMAEHGISCAGKTARQLRREDYSRYDYLIGMDRSNMRGMHRICGGDPLGKMSLLLDHTHRPGEVADPWYSGNFDQTWEDVSLGCRCLLEEIKQDIKI